MTFITYSTYIINMTCMADIIFRNLHKSKSDKTLIGYFRLEASVFLGKCDRAFYGSGKKTK